MLLRAEPVVLVARWSWSLDRPPLLYTVDELKNTPALQSLPSTFEDDVPA